MDDGDKSFEVLRYQYPLPKATELLPSSTPPTSETIRMRELSLDEVREALRQNGYTIVRTSRIHTSYYEQAVLDREFDEFRGELQQALLHKAQGALGYFVGEAGAVANEWIRREDPKRDSNPWPFPHYASRMLRSELTVIKPKVKP